jgi:Arc/MetJ family transcription regulator
MRTTLDIDDDLLAAAKELSRQQGRTAGEVVSMLLRQALTGASPGSLAARSRAAAAVGGFRPFASRGRPVTNDAIDALRDIEGV